MKYIFLFIFLFYLFIYLFFIIIIFRYAIAYLRTGSYAPDHYYEYCEFVCGLPYHVFRTQLFIEGVVVGKAYLQSNTTLLSIS